MNVTRAPASQPNLITVIQHVLADAFSSIHTAFPAQIETYDYKTAKANVKPLISATYPDGTSMELPVIQNVPVVWPRTSLGSISFPLQRGDGCLIVCSERSIDDWLSLGGQNVPTDPRAFDLNDAIAIPGLYSFASQTKITGNNKFEIHYKDQKVTIDESGNIEIGSASLKYLLNEDFITKVLNHTHGGVTAGQGISGTAAYVAPVTGATTTKVKAQ
jgi:hypothetical protein